MGVGPLSFPAEKLKLRGVVFAREADFETDGAIGGDFEACRLQFFGVEPLAQSAHGIAVTHVQRLWHEHRAVRALARHPYETLAAKVVEPRLFQQAAPSLP
jgi:hypothetical protein